MKLCTILLSELAKTQIDRTRAFWEARSPARASAIEGDLASAYGRLERFPEIGPPVQVTRRISAGTRRYILPSTGYHLYYRLDHEAKLIVVLLFRHEKQRPPKL